MAIRGHGFWGHTNGSYFADASLVGYGPGTALVLVNPSGAISGKPGDANNLVKASAGTSGEVFVGILRSTVYAWDKTRYCFHPEKYQSAATECTPVNVMEKGQVQLDSSHFTLTGTPSAGDALRLGPSGTFANSGGSVTGGIFVGTPDSDGAVVVRIDV